MISATGARWHDPRAAATRGRARKRARGCEIEDRLRPTQDQSTARRCAPVDGTVMLHCASTAVGPREPLLEIARRTKT
jgi:hypothetical protein